MMKYRSPKLILKGIEILVAIAMVLLVVANIVIANNVISSMADVRIDKNDATLDKYGLVGEQVSTLSLDGLKINSYIMPNDDSKGNVLILHGMHGMDATSVFDYARFIYDAGYTPVAIDMRAHGKSEGESLSFGYNEVYDVMSVINYLKKDSRFGDKPIILYGLSMGGSTAISTASKSEYVDGVIAVSPFLSIKNQVADYMKRDGAPSAFIRVFQPFINLSLQRKFNVNPTKDSPEYAVRNIKSIPVFIIHGDKDTQTAVYQSKMLFDNCSSNNKEIWIVQGKDHLVVEDVLDNSSKEYRDRVIKFLDNNFDK